MAGPSAKCMPYRRTVTACHGSDGNKTYTTTAELFLKHFAQVGCKYIRFDKGISEYGNAYLFAIRVSGRDTVECFVERSHSPEGGIAVIFNAGHACAAGIYKSRLYNRRQRDAVRISCSSLRFGVTKIAQKVYTPHRVFVNSQYWKPMKPK